MMLITLLILLFALAFNVSKFVLGYVDPFFLMGLRLPITGIIFLTTYRLWYGPLPSITKKDRLLFFQTLFFGIYLFVFLDLWSLQRLTAGKTAFLFNLTPFVSALFSYFYFLNE